MELNVNNCGNCPFHVYKYDDYAIGFDTIESCQLSEFLRRKEYYIDIYNQYDEIKKCDYCTNFEDDNYNEFGEDIDKYVEWDKTKCTCDDINNNSEITSPPEWCPLTEKITINKI